MELTEQAIRRARPALVALCLCWISCAAPSLAAPFPAVPSPAVPSPAVLSLAQSFQSPITRDGPLLKRGDLWFAAATVASVALATRLDRWAEDEIPENNGGVARGISNGAERLGSPLYVVPALFLVGAADKLSGRSDGVASVTRIASGVAAAGLAAGVVKLAVGRARPYQTPGDQDVLRPFSGYASFPSGHTTLAFGLASAIDSETKARWVPWVVYPLAGLTGWSRIRDDQHWSSDVVAGAALGYWTARKVVEIAQRRARSR